MNERTVTGYFIETGFAFATPGSGESSRDPIMFKVSKRRFDAFVKKLKELGVEFEIRPVYGRQGSVETCLYSRGGDSRMAPRDHGLFVAV